MEIWQEKLLNRIDKTDFKANEVKIYDVFRKLCEPFVGYKDCSFEDNSLRINNDIYTLQVDINDIIINYSKNGANPIEYKFSLRDNWCGIEHNYYISNRLEKHSMGDRNMDYENILNTLMGMIIKEK